MKGIFWNSRGLRDLAKPRFLHDVSIEHDLDFIALLETLKKRYSEVDLNSYCGGRDFFFWQWCAPKGRSGGILLGVNLLTLEVLNTSFGEFSIKMHLKNRSGGFK